MTMLEACLGEVSLETFRRSYLARRPFAQPAAFTDHRLLDWTVVDHVLRSLHCDVLVVAAGQLVDGAFASFARETSQLCTAPHISSPETSCTSRPAGGTGRCAGRHLSRSRSRSAFRRSCCGEFLSRQRPMFDVREHVPRGQAAERAHRLELDHEPLGPEIERDVRIEGVGRARDPHRALAKGS